MNRSMVLRGVASWKSRLAMVAQPLIQNQLFDSIMGEFNRRIIRCSQVNQFSP